VVVTATLRDVAAYLLDRADQYETESPCWVALSEVAFEVAAGEVEAAKRNGDLDASLYKRLARMTGVARPVDPSAGVEDDE
jgi:hypothetical protein